MSRATAKFLCIISTVIVLALVAIFSFLEMKTLITVSLLVWAGLYFLFLYRLRCPHCGRWPGRGDIFAHYCKHCGESLDD